MVLVKNHLELVTLVDSIPEKYIELRCQWMEKAEILLSQYLRVAAKGFPSKQETPDIDQLLPAMQKLEASICSKI